MALFIHSLSELHTLIRCFLFYKIFLDLKKKCSVKFLYALENTVRALTETKPFSSVFPQDVNKRHCQPWCSVLLYRRFTPVTQHEWPMISSEEARLTRVVSRSVFIVYGRSHCTNETQREAEVAVRNERKTKFHAASLDHRSVRTQVGGSQSSYVHKKSHVTCGQWCQCVGVVKTSIQFENMLLYIYRLRRHPLLYVIRQKRRKKTYLEIERTKKRQRFTSQRHPNDSQPAFLNHLRPST